MPRKITELDYSEARRYLLEAKNYINFDLPPYFDFQPLLDTLAATMETRDRRSLFFHPIVDGLTGKALYPGDFEGVNYRLLSNKDGEFSWRPFEIIHPALYVDLVHEMTKADNWEVLVRRFRYFEASSSVDCVSIPMCSDDDESHKAHQVKQWWSNVEQAAIKSSIQFQYVFDLDVSDCYGSIYTHSISWALHGRETARQGRNANELLGNQIDWSIGKMRYRQTNGIPQGSTLMDFIAEIVMGAIDIELSSSLAKTLIGPDSYRIIRYRDDYKILTNNPAEGRHIIKELSAVLSKWGLKLNTSKTKMDGDPILAAVKADKIYELLVPTKTEMSLSKRLLQIYAMSEKYPNSGAVVRQLNKYFMRVERMKELKEYDNAEVMIGILANMAVRNPKATNWCTSIMSQVLDFCTPELQAVLIDRIRNKINVLPNMGLLEVWLQRVSYKILPTICYDEQLTKIASGEMTQNTIWESTWLDQEVRNVVENTPIINQSKMEAMPVVVPMSEVALFRPPDFS